MARLRYSSICSLDGYVADPDGRFDWAAPDPELHEAVNAAERDVGTYLYGRRMFQTMSYWEAPDLTTVPHDAEEVTREYAAIWQAADKVVFSRSLTEVRTARTRVEAEFDPLRVRALVDEAHADVSIGGPTLAGRALAAGIVDDIALYLHPVVVGGGTAVLPQGLRLDLSLTDEHRFASGVVHLGYTVARS